MKAFEPIQVDKNHEWNPHGDVRAGHSTTVLEFPWKEGTVGLLSRTRWKKET
jgi:hypothetical protein